MHWGSLLISGGSKGNWDLHASLLNLIVITSPMCGKYLVFIH